MIFFKWKTVYLEAAIQNSDKNYHSGNFGEIIVHYLKLGVYTLVKTPSNNFQFRTVANLSYFTVDEKHSKVFFRKRTDLTCWIRYLLLNHNQLSSLSCHKYLVWCFYSDVRFPPKNDEHVPSLADMDLGNIHFRQRFYLVIEQSWKGNLIYIQGHN